MHQLGFQGANAPGRGCRGRGRPLPPAAQAMPTSYLNACGISRSAQPKAIFAIQALQQALQYNSLLNNLT